MAGVGLKGEPVRGMRAALAAILLVGCGVGATACASGSVPIPSASSFADPELRMLVRRARWGDKAAQLELGMRFEEGRGVTRNLDLAERLYARAAAASGGSILIYSPRVGHAPPQLIKLKAGPRIPGSIEARQRLERLRRSKEHSQ